MKALWIALIVGAGGYGLHAFASQLSSQTESAASEQRPMSAAEFALLNRSDPQALVKFLQSQKSGF